MNKIQIFLHKVNHRALAGGIAAIKYLYQCKSISREFAIELALHCLREVRRHNGFCYKTLLDILLDMEGGAQ
ncbi:MAG: hypothetical protein SNJ66_11180 [Chloroherpetonaceae bacterium]